MVATQIWLFLPFQDHLVAELRAAAANAQRTLDPDCRSEGSSAAQVDTFL